MDGEAYTQGSNTAPHMTAQRGRVILHDFHNATTWEYIWENLQPLSYAKVGTIEEGRRIALTE